MDRDHVEFEDVFDSSYANTADDMPDLEDDDEVFAEESSFRRLHEL